MRRKLPNSETMEICDKRIVRKKQVLLPYSPEASLLARGRRWVINAWSWRKGCQLRRVKENPRAQVPHTWVGATEVSPSGLAQVSQVDELTGQGSRVTGDHIQPCCSLSAAWWPWQQKWVQRLNWSKLRMSYHDGESSHFHNALSQTTGT